MATTSSRLPGDGIGPEILAPAVDVLERVVGDFEFEEHLFGGASIDAHGTALTDETLAACKRADAVLLGRRRRPEVGHDRPSQAASRAGPARPAQGARACTPTCVRSARCRRCYDASPLRARASSRAPTCSSCAS